MLWRFRTCNLILKKPSMTSEWLRFPVLLESIPDISSPKRTTRIPCLHFCLQWIPESGRVCYGWRWQEGAIYYRSCKCFLPWSNLYIWSTLTTSKIQKGPSGTRSDNIKSLKGTILDWIVPQGELLRISCIIEAFNMIVLAFSMSYWWRLGWPRVWSL